MIYMHNFLDIFLELIRKHGICNIVPILQIPPPTPAKNKKPGLYLYIFFKLSNGQLSKPYIDTIADRSYCRKVKSA